jgi:hypothetical protein
MASGYNWDMLYPFVVSLRRTGYTGRCVLVFGTATVAENNPKHKAANEDPSLLLEKLAEYGIETLDIGSFDEHPNVFRFKVISEYIKGAKDLRYVLTADTRDIVFQSNPFDWLARNLGSSKLVVVSEAIQLKRCWPWRAITLEAFGHDVYYSMEETEICNAGVIAGTPEDVSELLLGVYKMSNTDMRLKRFKVSYDDMPSDQAAMNIIIRKEPWASKTKIATVWDGFVFGAHHLNNISGLSYRMEGSSNYCFQLHEASSPVTILHQYDGVKEWQEAIRKKFNG